jgi:hypothetical protein
MTTVLVKKNDETNTLTHEDWLDRRERHFFQNLPFLQPHVKTSYLPAIVVLAVPIPTKILKARLGLKAHARRLNDVPMGTELFVHTKLGKGYRVSVLHFQIVEGAKYAGQRMIRFCRSENGEPSFTIGTMLDCQDVSQQSAIGIDLCDSKKAMHEFLVSFLPNK